MRFILLVPPVRDYTTTNAPTLKYEPRDDVRRL
jgi:hypothetical protein